VANLSEREMAILELLAQGMTGPEIAEELGLDWRTVKVHRYNAFRKLGVHTSTAAVAVCLRTGVFL
jgi:LuxR family transcriptional regulator, regulator of acetate metabolism